VNSRMSAQVAFQSSPNSFRSFLSITLRQTTERAFCHVRQSLDYIFVNLYLATVTKESRCYATANYDRLFRVRSLRISQLNINDNIEIFIRS